MSETEPCEGACGSQVFAELDGSGRYVLRAVTKHGTERHTPESCRRLAQAARDRAAEKVEAKRVVRHFQRYTSEQRASHAASHRLGHQQRHAVGEHFYTHPDVPGVAFTRRGDAARAALRRLQSS